MMVARITILLSFAACLVLTASAQSYRALRGSTDAAAGKRMQLSYNPEGNALSMQENLLAKVYFYRKSKPAGDQQINLVRRDSVWTGALQIPDSTVLLSIVFSTASGESTDNNHNEGYLLPVLNRGKPVRLAYATMSRLLARGAPDASGLRKNQQRALILMKKEIQLYPQSDSRLMATYYNMLANSPEREDKVELVNRLSALKSDQEDELMMAQLYLSYFGSKRQADSLDRLLISKFPAGKYLKAKKAQTENKPRQEPLTESLAGQHRPISQKEVLLKVEESKTDEQVAPLLLKDISGNEVYLGAGELKDKVIVLDFWATWCKPCIASFPAMKKVMERYQHNSAVRFFFVSTMEQDDALQKTKAFLEKNPFPFRVLMDEKSEDMNLYKAYSHYKASGGIPYKLVIDAKGHIRFRASGFSGNEQLLIAELSAMIDQALAIK